LNKVLVLKTNDQDLILMNLMSMGTILPIYIVVLKACYFPFGLIVLFLSTSQATTEAIPLND
jgi:hypothetical protein